MQPYVLFGGYFRLSRDTGDIMVSSYRVGLPYSYISTGCYHKLFWFCNRRLLFASEISFFFPPLGFGLLIHFVSSFDGTLG
jgi:hypothetical protein